MSTEVAFGDQDSLNETKNE